MSKPGRKPNAIPRVRMSIWLRMDLAAEVELLLTDPMRDRAKYGAKISYFESLVEHDLNSRRRDAKQPRFISELEQFIQELVPMVKDEDCEGIKNLIERYGANDPSGDDNPSSEGPQPEDPTGGSPGSSLGGEPKGSG